MSTWRVEPDLPLTLLNGAGMVVQLCFLGWMARYLLKKARGRGFRWLSWQEWRHGEDADILNFAVAVTVFTAGVCAESAFRWTWRMFFNAADFGPGQIAFLALALATVVTGALCKIRSVTNPDLGHWPWIAALIASILFTAATWFFY